MTAHLNTSYRHFFLFVHEVRIFCEGVHRYPLAHAMIILFCDKFDLVDKRELAPLDELNDAILAEEKTR